VQTWYALWRAWAEWDEESGSSWRQFGVDELAGHPTEFHGDADDALRQLEDELRTTITPATKVERHERRLLLVWDFEDGSGEEFVEYRLIDRAARPSAGKPVRNSPRAALDRSGATPNQFLHEFEDVAGDVALDMDLTIAHLDEEAGGQIAEIFIQMMDIDNDDHPGEIIRNVMSVMLWIFFMGREHAQRGYSAPVVSDDGERMVHQVLASLFSAGERPVSPEPASAGRSDDPAVDASGQPRSMFGAEFHEVAADVIVDYGSTMLDLDEQVGSRVNDFVIQLIRLGEQDEERVVFNLLSGALWMFRLGREHAGRGYGSPVPRGDGESEIPDTLIEFYQTDD
jgi:hypothetical protein